MKSCFVILAGVMLVQVGFAQERSAVGVAETQMNWSALSNNIGTVSTKVEGLNTRVDVVSTRVDTVSSTVDTLTTRVNQAIVCGRNNMLYAPGASGASSAGCKAIPTQPAPQIRQVMNRQELPQSGGNLFVYCNSDEILTGGGGYCDSSTAINCRHAGNTPSGNGWMVGGWADDGRPVWTVYAICMKR